MIILHLLTTIDRTQTLRFTGILNHEAIAYCELGLNNDQVHVATLYSVYVDSAHRAHGYAQHLVSAAIGAAPGHGKTVVNLRVHEANKAALILYHNLGFEQYEGPDKE